MKSKRAFRCFKLNIYSFRFLVIKVIRLNEAAETVTSFIANKSKNIDLNTTSIVKYLLRLHTSFYTNLHIYTFASKIKKAIWQSIIITDATVHRKSARN